MESAVAFGIIFFVTTAKLRLSLQSCDVYFVLHNVEHESLKDGEESLVNTWHKANNDEGDKGNKISIENV